MSSLVEAVHRLGLRDAVLAKLDAAAGEMVEAPHLKSWWPGEHLVALLLATEAVGGAGTVRRVGIDASRHRMGKLVKPLAGVLLAMAKSPLHALMSRLGTFVSAGVQGVDARFLEDEGKNRATVHFKFPEPVPEVMAELWYGFFEVGFELAKSGRLVERTVESAEHRFVITW